MKAKHFVLAAAFLAALIGCGDDDEAPVDAGGMDAGRVDAGADAGDTDAGDTDTDAGDTDSGTTDAGDTDAGAMDGGTDAGDPFATDAGDSIEIRDGAVSLADAGSADAGTVPITIAAVITRQVSPTERNAPAVLEVATLTFHPIELQSPRVNAPSGWRIGSVTEDLGQRSCPTPGAGDRERCRQHFVLELYPDGACRFDGSDFIWTWDVACAPGGDCESIPAAFETFSIVARPIAGDFCAGFPDPTFDAFFPSNGLLVPTTGTDPVTLRFFTTIDHPYTLAAGTAVPPAGFTLVSFTEDETSRQCDTTAFPDACQQWWDVVVDPGTACSPRGTYAITWTVGCQTGGDCDPAITEYTTSVGLTDDRDLCP